MERLKTILLLALAALLLVDAADCFTASKQQGDDMDCCQSMPCTPANQNHDCCKNMVVERAPYLVTAVCAFAPVLVAVAGALPFVPSSATQIPAFALETRDHVPPPISRNLSLPLLI